MTESIFNPQGKYLTVAHIMRAVERYQQDGDIFSMNLFLTSKYHGISEETIVEMPVSEWSTLLEELNAYLATNFTLKMDPTNQEDDEIDRFELMDMDE